ncbi:MAG: hypothetical protein GYB68_17995 [Chloroflexi bacterium]|nr:hypothetical protein [Chloroflexota bacterium]
MPADSPLPTSRLRPLTVTILALAVLLLAGQNIVRAVAALTYQPILPNINLTRLVRIDGLLAIIWGLIWLAIGVGLWRRTAWARHAALWALPLYALIFTVQAALLTEGIYEQGLLLSRFVLWTIICAVVVYGLTRPEIIRRFDEAAFLREGDPHVDRQDR